MSEPAIQTVLDISNAKPGPIKNRGKWYRAVGYNDDGTCPTDICNAMCCRVCNLKGEVVKEITPTCGCEFLDRDDNKCKLHKLTDSMHCKPVSCVVWPTSQLSIDKANSIAERLGFEGRCQLRMEEIK